MKIINRELFYQKINRPIRPLTQLQVDALNFLFDKLDASTTITTLSEYSYILATVKHETADSYKPITERGAEAYLQSKHYYPYIGRGYVQLTWKYNYRTFAQLLDIPLVREPQLANDPEIAWKILELGMVRGLYTGKKLSDYFNASGAELSLDKRFIGYRNMMGYLVTPRRIINGTDRYKLIGEYAIEFFMALELKEASGT